MAVKKRVTQKKQKQQSNLSSADSESPESVGSDRVDSSSGNSGQSFPIVGIGASAGGLSAFESFFSAMPADRDPGMAFILVQHLSPDHKSILTDLVKRYTRMKVQEAKDGMVVEPNNTYIIPPNRDMAFLGGTLQLLEQTTTRGLRLPIDFLFRSLAQEERWRSICIVLSGTGSDGTHGVRAIKGEGGLVIVQTPESTDFDGMPRSAIATGLVDFVLHPSEMPDRLIIYAQHAFSRFRSPKTNVCSPEVDTLKKICIVLRDRTGHDFSQYKENTLCRRMERRMALHQIDRDQDYLQYLMKNKAEVDALFRDLLIGVTNFFRDADAFDVLRQQALPHLIDGKPPASTIRIWVCGCSTGEEAYSIAMLMQELLEKLQQAHKVQIFATDIDQLAIDKARAGIFPTSIAADIDSHRLARFFIREPHSEDYRIQKSIRDMVIFSEQDVLKDPPFSRLDLISCRNLLIYLNVELQKKLIPLFHYSLNSNGILFLGSSESIGDSLALFSILDRKWKLYQKKESPDAVHPVRGYFLPSPGLGDSRIRHRKSVVAEKERFNFRDVTEQTLHQHNNQVAILVNSRGDILHIAGRTGRYLEPAPGDITDNIIPMARPGLQRELTTALHLAISRKESVVYGGLTVKTNGDSVTVNLTVRPAVDTTDFFLVILDEIPPPAFENSEDQITSKTEASAVERKDRISSLEHELRAKEEYLQTTLEEMETANEELKSTNEEMQSVNEELQSTNEELETSKEELQSVNEELATVNAELQTKVIDLSRANNDMNNLLASTGIGTLFVDHQLRISRFTPAIARIINLIGTDIGRPVSHIVSNLEGYDRMVDDVNMVLDTLIPLELEVCTKKGDPYLMRIQPYRTIENVIEGAVITFVDISETKRLEKALKNERISLFANMIATVREPVLVLNHELRVIMASKAFYTLFHVSRKETEDHLLFELGNHQWEIPKLRHMLEEILPHNFSFNDFEVSHEFERIGRRTMLLNARQIFSGDSSQEMIILTMEDMSGNIEIETK